MEVIIESLHERWVQEAKKVSEYLLIFTPYFDSSVLEIIKQASDRDKRVTFITAISKEYIMNNPHQIKTLKKISDAGVEIRHLEDLHAKILVVDTDFLSIGSQNFTMQGQKNKEATVVITESEEIYKILDEKIYNLARKATKLSHEYIEALYNEFKDLKKMEARSVKFLTDIEKRLSKVNFEVRREELKARSRKHILGSFKVWVLPSIIKFDKNQNWNSTGIRLQMLPLLYIDEAEIRMRFARVTNSRIGRLGTDVASNVPNEIKNKIGSRDLKLEIHFELEEKSEFNIRFDLHFNDVGEKFSIYTFFDGFDFKDLKITPENPLSEQVRNAFYVKDDFWGEHLNQELLTKLLDRFRYATPLKSTDDKIDKLIPSGGWHEISVVGKDGKPMFLLIERI